ncbi:uncharacterized protein BJ212DRAFT_1301018 [Suillus subaureus]|uniref:Uncharacterized protein n=1 Tax=Suillus subaureus TaxID=48587 RepID=A0A9P7E810_9AGAM|nr:uncharacterized protein BJ212DRAFT_1301018 [Suillus subaureus]KAG1813638.1 hypothetical protein BJ212DRAFT_1301018 [Suillus subaureus]
MVVQNSSCTKRTGTLNNQAKFNALVFAEFVKEIQTYWLPTDWVDVVHRKMLASVQAQCPFTDYYAEGITEKDLWHTLDTCQKGFPDGTSYKALMAATVATKKARKNGGVVAAVDIEGEDNNTVAVVMPSAVLGDDTDSGKECMAPLQTPHLHWNCLLDRPAVTSPVSVHALIDHGSSLVLIGEDLINKLGL